MREFVYSDFGQEGKVKKIYEDGHLVHLVALIDGEIVLTDKTTHKVLHRDRQHGGSTLLSGLI